jgi:hypothetical protein
MLPERRTFRLSRPRVVDGLQLGLRRFLDRVKYLRDDGQLVQEPRHGRVIREEPGDGLGNLFEEPARRWLREARAGYRTRGPGGSGPSLRCLSRSSCWRFSSSAMRCASLCS